MFPRSEENIILSSSMHFSDSINPDSQMPNIVEYYNQTKSGVDTVDQMVVVVTSCN